MIRGEQNSDLFVIIIVTDTDGKIDEEEDVGS
jgi:hypothetical protein